jgi:zinc transport system permease protein
MLYIGLNPALARAHRVQVAAYRYIYAALLSLVVIMSVRAVGVLLVTALLIVPAATARNLARSAGAMFWWALVVSLTSAVAGLLVSAQTWAQTATGATVVLCACVWFLLSAVMPRGRSRGAEAS